MIHRISILLLNIFFPPLAVMIMTGLGSPETIINSLLFILAVIPSHIHGFIVSWRYFHRKEKLEQPQWEGVRSQQHQRRHRSRSSNDDHHRQRRRNRRSTASSSHTSFSVSSTSSSGSDYDESGKRRVWQYEVEEFSDRDNNRVDPSRFRRMPQRIQYAEPYRRSISDVPPPAPPACPSPPTHGNGQRYLE